MYINMEKKFITIKKAAQMLGVSTLTLRNWDNTGKFPAGRHPISNYRVYLLEDVEKLLEDMGRMDIVSRARKEKNAIKKLSVKHL